MLTNSYCTFPSFEHNTFRKKKSVIVWLLLTVNSVLETFRWYPYRKCIRRSCTPLHITIIKSLICDTLYLQEMSNAARTAWIMSVFGRPESRCVFAVRIYTDTAAASFTLNRHLLFDPFTINTLSITQTPHFGEKYEEMAWIAACSPRAWTQSALQESGASIQTVIERHYRVLA